MSSHACHARTRPVVRAGALAAVAGIAAPLGLFVATAPASATPATCRTDQLQASWDDSGTARSSTPTGKQETAVVKLRNSSDDSCTLQGHPGVSLTQGKSSETLRDTSKPEPKSVSLAPGKSTTFTLIFLSEKDEPKQAITPEAAVVTPPDNKASTTLPWKWGPVTKQEGATHPGNAVGPVGATVEAGSGSSASKQIDCGSGWNNLSVRAVTSHGKDACPVALKVSTAYGKAVEAKKAEPITITVNDTGWKCQQKQGDPNPYTECVNTKEPAEKVQLLS